MRMVLAAAAAALALTANVVRAEPVYFNHAMVVVDPQTYAAITSAPFIAERLGVAERRATTVDGGAEAFSGFYVYGRSTYLELMAAGEKFVGQAPAGSAALGMWIDHREALPGFVAPLSRGLGAPMALRTRTRRIGSTDIDWFQYTDWADPKLSPDSSDTWLMAPFADYQARLHPDRPPPAEPLTRAANNALRYDPKRLFRDIVAIRMSARPEEVRRLTAEFRAYGERVSRRGRTVRVVTPDCVIVLTEIRPGEPYRVSFDIALNPGPHPRAPMRIGRSTLSFGKRVAHWRFTG